MVVLPYIETSQSAVIQLAYGFRQPVITTDTAGIPKSKWGTGCCLIVPPRDSQALADAIGEFFSNPSYQDRAQALEPDPESSSWKRLVDLLEHA